jgi:hypothetical protein
MKKLQPVVIALTAVNFVMLAFIVSGRVTARAEEQAPILRGRALELVDPAGQTRVEVKIEPDGEAVFRMRDGAGDIRVKIGADGGGSALLLLDEQTEPGVHIVSRRAPAAGLANTTGITLTGAGGSRRTITPVESPR